MADRVAYHYGQGKFVVTPRPTFGKAYPLFIYQGTAIRKDSDEAKAQIAAGYGKYAFSAVMTLYIENARNLSNNGKNRRRKLE